MERAGLYQRSVAGAYLRTLNGMLLRGRNGCRLRLSGEAGGVFWIKSVLYLGCVGHAVAIGVGEVL